MDATNSDARDAIAALGEECAALRSLVGGLSDEQLAEVKRRVREALPSGDGSDGAG